MTYARARLWLGISGVGFLVVVSAAALWFDLPHRWLGGSSDTTAIALALGCYVLISIPSDLLGGYVLPRRHGRGNGGFRKFAGAWLRGVMGQAVVMGICAAAILKAAQQERTGAGIACCGVLMILLIQGQLFVARMVGSFSLEQRGGTADGKLRHVYRSADSAFVGGITGLPGLDRVILPALWLDELPADAARVQEVRRAGVIASGARWRGLLVAMVWNLVGFMVASQMPRAALSHAPGLVTAGLWFTLWSFLGLLLLPSVSRPGVFEADRYALDHGIEKAKLAGVISRLDRLQDDEPSRSRWVERIFHPIPSVTSRMEAMEGTKVRHGAWQGARVALFLSWACFGFLSRAVHCNAGRPDLWVLFPGD